MDSKHQFTPRRMRKIKNGLKSIYTDHFSLEVGLTGLPKAGRGKEQEQEQEVSAWNLRRQGGWEEYTRLTEANKDKFEAVVEDQTITVEEIMKRINAIDKKIKFQAFGKTRKTSKKFGGNKSKSCETVEIWKQQRRLPKGWKMKQANEGWEKDLTLPEGWKVKLANDGWEKDPNLPRAWMMRPAYEGWEKDLNLPQRWLRRPENDDWEKKLSLPEGWMLRISLLE